jgi:glucose/arabinose dehydrogenase
MALKQIVMKKFTFFISMMVGFLYQAQTVVLQEFATGLNSPVEITNANDSRLFVVQQTGQIKIVQPSGAVNVVNFLDISTKITYGGERGLLGLAFHPQYATNGYFFVYYNNLAGNITVARYSVSSTDPNVANPASEKLMLDIPKPFSNHNGGSIHFGPDGYLWISTGDGGSGGDPNNNGQNKNALLAKMLRIDVNSTGPYNIPPSNPFVGIDGADEVWSYGLRNAWKFSFDLTAGNVMVADVGQNQIEEINRMPISQPAINYGWRCYEGNAAYNTAGCAAASTMTFPVATYDHSGGKCSITGGYVYRGSLYPAFAGKYFFADYCSAQIGMMNPDNSITWTTAFSGNNFSTFGQDSQKELYVASISNGKLYKLTTTTLGTQEHVQDGIRIYPNPASGKIFVKGLSQKNMQANFTNAEGRTVLESKVKDDGSVDISGLSAGIYFVTIRSENLKIYSQKLVVK